MWFGRHWRILLYHFSGRNGLKNALFFEVCSSSPRWKSSWKWPTWLDALYTAHMLTKSYTGGVLVMSMTLWGAFRSKRKKSSNQIFSSLSAPGKDRRTGSRIRRKKHSAAPPGIELFNPRRGCAVFFFRLIRLSVLLSLSELKRIWFEMIPTRASLETKKILFCTCHTVQSFCGYMFTLLGGKPK